MIENNQNKEMQLITTVAPQDNLQKERSIMMNGTFIDMAAIVVGGLIGFFANSKLISDELQDKDLSHIPFSLLPDPWQL